MSGALAGCRIGLLTASASRLGGGVSEAVLTQAGVIRAAGGEAVVFALEDEHAAADAQRYGVSPVITCPVRGPRQVGYAPGLIRQLLEADLDCLHLHGIWMYPSCAGLNWARQTHRPYVISPHGMLDPWITGRGRLKKRLARWGYERASWNAATAFHALTAREASDIARESGRRESTIIPNAGPQASTDPAGSRAPQILFISRIHPKKNLVALIAAWSAVAASGALPCGAQLRIAGWGAAQDVAALQALLANAPTSVKFIGPCFGVDKANELAAARYVILPSLSEGLPITLLEAWAAGTPTLQSAECNLPEGFTAGAAIDCGISEEELARAIAKALTMAKPDWLAMSRAALGLARGPFSSARVAEQWGQAYAAMIAAGAGRRP